MNKKIESFTGLRFIMIMLIVIIHLDGIIQYLGEFGEIHHRIFSETYMMAVDFFFILSGFGMMYGNLLKIKDEELSIPSITDGLKYAINHIKKIYPTYIATILFGLIIVVVKELIANTVSIKFCIKQIIQLIINISLLQSATAMTFFTHAYNGAAWFLSSLFCIYLVSPFFIVLFRKISRSLKSDLLFMCLNIFLIIVLSGLFTIIENKCQQINGIPEINGLVYSSPYRRLFYVLLGMNIAMFFSRLKERIDISKRIATILEIIISLLAIVHYFILRIYIKNYSYCMIIDMVILILFFIIFAFDKGIYHSNLKIDYSFITHYFDQITDKLNEIMIYGVYLIGKKSGKKYYGTIYQLMQIMNKVLGPKITINRFKGLGEMNIEDLRETVTNPTTRTLTKVTIDDAAKAARSVEIFMSDANIKLKRLYYSGTIDFD